MYARHVFNPVQALGPNGIIVKNSFRSRTAYKLNYTWIIENYSAQRYNSCLVTPVFSDVSNPKFRWRLILTIDYSDDVCDVMVTQIQLDKSSECDTGFLKYRCSILDDELNENHTFTSDEVEEIGRGEEGCGPPDIILTSSLPNPKLLPNDELTIYWEVTFSETSEGMENLTESTPDSIQVQPDRVRHCISENLDDLFRNQEFTDVTLSVNGKEYRAHKIILAARSPVFAAMFKHKTLESENNLVNIIDIDEKVVEGMLQYVYTDKCECLNDQANGLLAASNKYGLEGLKIICQGFLIDHLTVENAPETLGLADLHSALELKSKTIDFIVADSIRITKSVNWKKFNPSYSKSLVVELFEALSRQVAA